MPERRTTTLLLVKVYLNVLDVIENYEIFVVKKNVD